MSIVVGKSDSKRMRMGGHAASATVLTVIYIQNKMYMHALVQTILFTKYDTQPFLLNRTIMAALLAADLTDAAVEVCSQLGDAGYSESVLQTAFQVELQARGYCVQSEVSYPVTYIASSGVTTIVGQVRVDLLVQSSVDPTCVAIVEVKKAANGNHAAQLTRYERVAPQGAAIVLFSPAGLVWHSAK